MKRPLAVAGITMLVTLSVLCLADSPWLCVAVSAAVFVLLGIHLIKGRNPKSDFIETVLISVAVSCLLALSSMALIEAPAMENISEKRLVQLEITDYPTENNGRYYFKAKLLGSDSLLKPNVRLSLSKADELADSLGPGDKIEYTGKVYKLSEKDKSVNLSYKSKKILLGTYPFGKITLIQKGGHGLSFLIKNERRRVKNIVLKSFDSDTAGLVIAVLFGDKSFISDEVYSLFRSSGVAHIMAVSGLHLSIWVLFVMRAVGFSGLDERKAAVFLLIFTALIMAFADFSGSILRAGLMMLLYLLGKAAGKQTDPLESLGFAAVVILLLNPYASFNLSFLLSFSATLAIIVFALALSGTILDKLRPKLKGRFVGFAAEAVIDCVLISFCVSLFSLPIAAMSFGYVSVVSVVTNLMLLPVITLFVLLSGLFVIFCAVPVLGGILGAAVSAGAKYFFFTVRLFGSSERSIYRFRSDTVWLWLTITVILFILLYAAIKKKKKALYFSAAVFFLVSFPLTAVLDSSYKNTHYDITVHEVQDGLAVSVSTRTSSILLIQSCDSYHAGFIKRSLMEKNCSVEYAVVLGDNAEAAALLNEIPVGHIVTADSDLSSLSPENRKKTVSGNVLSADENCLISVSGGQAIIEIYEKRFAVSEDFCQADVLITNNPEILLDNQTKTDIIVSSETSSDCAYSTADYSDIVLTVGKDGKYTLKGENEWRYLMKSS